VPAELKPPKGGVGEDMDWSVKPSIKGCEEITTRSGAIIMKKVITGLRVSELKAMDEDMRAGLDRGRTWARETAKIEELTRLVQEFRGLDVGKWAEGFTEISSVYSPADIVYFILATKGRKTHRAAAEFWKGSEEHCHNAGFIAGFVHGASQVWDEIKDKA
jgi:hypothetical protein